MFSIEIIFLMCLLLFSLLYGEMYNLMDIQIWRKLLLIG